MNTPSLTAASDQTDHYGLISTYHELGWVLTRASKGSKAPIDSGWQNAPAPTDAQLRSWFEAGTYNPGLRLGQVSRNLHDLDCDDARLVPFLNALAPEWAQACPRWVRGSNPHVLVKTDAPLAYRKFSLGGRTLLEVRGDGHQSLVPPATHPSGEDYRWIDGPHEPPTVAGEDLLRWVEDAIVAFALSLSWVRGMRHELALAASGWMARRGLSLERALRIIEIAGGLAADAEMVDRRRALDDTFAAIATDQPATGFPTLKRLLPQEAIALLQHVWPVSGGEDEERVGQYVAKGGQVFVRYQRGDDAPTLRELANFDVRIVREFERDDGSEAVSRVLELEGRHGSGGNLPGVRVNAADFSNLNWVIRELGAGCVVAAGQTNKDKVREAIQRLSPSRQLLRVYTHTGWRQIDGSWQFLHAGMGDDVSVELEGQLAKYRLPIVHESPREAVMASLALRELGDRPVMTVLWCAMYLAPLASILQPDLTVWLWGPTGAFKSTVAALFLSHFGNFERKHLPADWSSTENALERLAFLAKDVPLVIDEFAPPPTNAEQQKLIAKAARIIRAQGNHSGRGRMRADTTLREAFPPRGIIISTAETPAPLPASAVARTFHVELRKSAIEAALLSQAQATSGMLADAMATYIEWLAEHYDDLGQVLQDAQRAARDAHGITGHRRTPESVAHLLAAATVALKTFRETGALTPEEAALLMEEIRQDLDEVAARQDAEVARANPAERFLSVLSECFAKKVIHCVGRTGGEPPEADELGWIQDHGEIAEIRYRPGPTASRVGWADEDWLYLLPDESFRLVTRFLSESGEVLGTTQKALHRALHDAGLIEVEETPSAVRRTVRAQVGGGQQRVLKLKRRALGEEIGDDRR